MFGAPSYNLNRIGSATAFSGEMLSMPRSNPNSSYAVTFPGPALQCRDLGGALRDAVVQNISATMDCDILTPWRSRSDTGLRPCFVQPMYMAWAPNETATVAFSGTYGNGSTRSWSANTIGPNLADLSQSAQLYVASQPTIEGKGPWSFVGCELHNATYTLNVTFTNGNQHVNITQLEIEDPLPYIATLSLGGTASDNDTDPLDGFSAQVFTTLDHFAYQSIMDMLGRLITGQVTIMSRLATGAFNFSTVSTSIMQTSLINTPELRPIFNLGNLCNSGTVVCSGTDVTNENLNITAPAISSGTIRLPQALEQLFQNMTLSLLSDSAFVKPAPNTTFLLRAPQNRYVYTSWRLLVPYLVGLGISALALAAGFWALLQNGESYSQSFATILRTTRVARLDVRIEGRDARGTDPCPEYIHKARIDLGALRTGMSPVEDVALKTSSR